MCIQGIDMTIEKALQGQGFTVVSQPIVTDRGHCIGFEALSRFASGYAPDVVWRHAKKMRCAAALDAMAIGKALNAGRDLPGRLFVNLCVINREILERVPRGWSQGGSLGKSRKRPSFHRQAWRPYNGCDPKATRSRWTTRAPDAPP